MPKSSQYAVLSALVWSAVSVTIFIGGPKALANEKCISILSNAKVVAKSLPDDLGYALQKGIYFEQLQMLRGNERHSGGRAYHRRFILEFLWNAENLPPEMLILARSTLTVRELMSVARNTMRSFSPHTPPGPLIEEGISAKSTEHMIHEQKMAEQKINDQIERQMRLSAFVQQEFTRKYGFDIGGYVKDLNSLRRDIVTRFGSRESEARFKPTKNKAWAQLMNIAAHDPTLLPTDLLENVRQMLTVLISSNLVPVNAQLEADLRTEAGSGESSDDQARMVWPADSVLAELSKISGPARDLAGMDQSERRRHTVQLLNSVDAALERRDTGGR